LTRPGDYPILCETEYERGVQRSDSWRGGRRGDPRPPFVFRSGRFSVEHPFLPGGLMCLAVPGQVVAMVDERNRLARVDVVGIERNVNVGLLDTETGGVRPGDWVLIHVGFAISKIDEAEAQLTLRLLEELGAEYEAELEEFRGSAIE